MRNQGDYSAENTERMRDFLVSDSMPNGRSTRGDFEKDRLFNCEEKDTTGVGWDLVLLLLIFLFRGISRTFAWHFAFWS